MLIWIQRAIALLILLYSKYFPVEKGKEKLRNLALRVLEGKTVIAHTRDKSMFVLSFPQDRGRENIYLRGTYEPGSTDVIRRVLGEEDIVFDLGANIGWYTILAARIVTCGQCHAFEPLPSLFEKLQKNCFLNKLSQNLFLNQVAVGDKKTTVELHTFAGLPLGHSSLSMLRRDDYSTFEVSMTTLDDYLTINSIKRVDLVKMDVEGAEMSVLQGSTAVFDLDFNPMWLIEMNEETSSCFGYSPSDLLRFLEGRASYTFFRIIDSLHKVICMSSLEEWENGENVLCIPSTRQDKLGILDELSRRW